MSKADQQPHLYQRALQHQNEHMYKRSSDAYMHDDGIELFNDFLTTNYQGMEHGWLKGFKEYVC